MLKGKETMKRTIDIDKTYKCNAKKAIEKFFAKHTELEYWKESFEYMERENVENFNDRRMSDGTYNKDWCYSLWLIEEDCCTYIAIVERN